MIRTDGRHFPKPIILTAIQWYLAYSLSYRDVEELLAERGIVVDHSTIARWVTRYPLPRRPCTAFSEKQSANITVLRQ